MSNCIHGLNPCDDNDCEACCDHQETDHGICQDCGADRTEHLAGVAESAFEGDR